VALNRTSDQGYLYSCGTDEYDDKQYSLCEKGDLSTKLGLMYESSSGSKYFSSSDSYIVDYDPPYQGNYDEDDVVSYRWNSIVFHCNEDGSRMVCADIVESDDECEYSIDDDDSTDDQLDNVDITLIVMGGVIFLIAVILFIVIYCHYCYLPVEVTHDPSETRHLI
jgi:hypothetical protein